jgi:hypothetical protein
MYLFPVLSCDGVKPPGEKCREISDNWPVMRVGLVRTGVRLMELACLPGRRPFLTVLFSSFLEAPRLTDEFSELWPLARLEPPMVWA